MIDGVTMKLNLIWFSLNSSIKHSDVLQVECLARLKEANDDGLLVTKGRYDESLSYAV